MLFEYFRLHLLIGLLHFLHLFLGIIHYPTQRLLTYHTLVHNNSTSRAKHMPTFYLHRASELSLALLTSIIYFVLLYTLQCLLDILFSSQFRITNPPPSLLLCPFEIPLLLPTSFIIRPIMKIKTTITKWTIPRIMPILTQSKIVIKSTSVSNCTVHSWWTLSLSELLLCVDYFILCECVISIAIDASVDFSIHFSLFNVFGDIDILHILPFSQLLLQQQLLSWILLLVIIY